MSPLIFLPTEGVAGTSWSAGTVSETLGLVPPEDVALTPVAVPHLPAICCRAPAHAFQCLDQLEERRKDHDRRGEDHEERRGKEEWRAE